MKMYKKNVKYITKYIKNNIDINILYKKIQVQ